ncbi:hypothetical protein CROQUDRAFT_91182 [Cronartium quercuum f. sp. fusiforme G11]|uniref:Uncharacterized protein n=1 Tax=Cronartium quercuum f. sp. fusiforme G11 TaxID=708437 RepID=A0A9P6NP28_9BASI|nr:hypothetical protein CROQUDRAFT_91182 [Cronartium quercuum f. sp. fusiforme G11]
MNQMVSHNAAGSQLYRQVSTRATSVTASGAQEPPPPAIAVSSAARPTPQARDAPSQAHLAAPETPRTRCVHDMLGAEDVGNVGAILQEVVKMLKNLPTGGYQGLNTSVRAAEITATPAGSFRCDKVAFHNVVTLAEHGLRVLAQVELQPSLPPDTLLATVLAGVQAIEAKVDVLMLDSAPPPPKGPTFAQAAQKVPFPLPHTKLH